MSDLYERIFELCAKRGISIGKMCADLEISRGNLTELKMGRIKTLKADNLTKISGYFDVSIDYLLGNERREELLINEDGELTEYLDMLKNRSEMRMLFSTTKNATKAQVEAIVKMVEEMRAEK